MDLRSVFDLKSVIDTRRKGIPDVPLFLAVVTLIGIGIAMSYSASAVYALKTFGDSFYFLKRQLLWFLVGFATLFLFQSIDYRRYAKLTKIILPLAFILLILIYIPGIGHSAKGSMRWISLGFFKLQPSEFVKIFLVIYLVKVFSISDENGNFHIMQLLIPMIIIAGFFLLILLQPDFGTSMDILIVSVLIFFVSGFPFRYILMLAVVSVPAFYLMIYQVSYRKDRIFAYLDPWNDRFGIGYHIIQSFIAFKIGGLLGTGLGYGTQKLYRLPEPHTDFIFAVIGEETGFIGTSFIIMLYLFFFWRGIKIARSATDNFGRLLAMGLTLLIVVQGFINISVVTGAIPTTGIPLPFISYGGSSLLACMICSGILLNISKYRDVVHEGLKNQNLTDEVWNEA